jgi:hypothetical protein
MNNSNNISSETYKDDLLDEMERGELNMDISFKDYYDKDNDETLRPDNLSFNRRVINTSKRLFNITTGLTRQKSDVSLKSESSNESVSSSEISPYNLEEGDREEYFNWQISEQDFDTNKDYSRLNDFYNDYKTRFDLPSTKLSQYSILNRSNELKGNFNNITYLSFNKINNDNTRINSEYNY